jgi:hypothetical protein
MGRVASACGRSRSRPATTFSTSVSARTELAPYADKLSHMLRQEAGKSANRSGRRSNCTPIWRPSAMTARTIAWRLSPQVEGGPATRAEDRRSWRIRAPGVRGRRGVPVRLVGRLGDHRRRANQAAGRSRQALLQPRLHSPRILSRPTRCCSTPITTPSVYWAACRGAASKITCAPQSINVGARSG